VKVLFVLSDIQLPPKEGLHKQTLLLMKAISRVATVSTYCLFRNQVPDADLLRHIADADVIGQAKYSGKSILFALGTKRRVKSAAIKTINGYSFDVIVLDGAAAISLSKSISSNAVVANWVDPGSVRYGRFAKSTNVAGRKVAYTLAAWAYKILERRARRFTQKRVYVSPSDAAEVRRLGDQHATAIPIIADLDTGTRAPKSANWPDEEKIVLVYVDGTVSHGREALLTALRELSNAELPDATVVRVLARVEEDVELRAASGRLSVEFMKWVDDPAVELANCTVAVLPDLYGSGVKNRTIEALSLAPALLATSVALEGIGVSEQLRSTLEYESGDLITAVEHHLHGRKPRTCDDTAEVNQILSSMSSVSVARRWASLLNEVAHASDTDKTNERTV